MRDSIIRQEAINALCKVGCGSGHCGVSCDDVKAIEQLPSAQQWIPVTERLPEVGRSVLLSVGKGLYTAEGFLKDDGTWAQYRWSANLKNVDAWAEMPGPWKGEE